MPSNILRPACAAIAMAVATVATAQTPLPVAGAPAFVHAEWLDTSVDPLTDFYHYANGGFLKANPIPDAYSSWGQFAILNERNQAVIHEFLEAAAKDASSAPGSELRKLGDLFASGMDEAAIEQAGIEPLEAELNRIDAMRTRADLGRTLAHLQSIGVNAGFGVGQMQDYSDSTQVVGVLGQGGLGLPDRDYYLKDDPKYAATRKFYEQHIGRMLVLLGAKDGPARRGAQAVLALETRLAKASMPVERRRDPHAIYHMTSMEELATAVPAIDWPAFLRTVGAPSVQRINLAMPEFFAAFSKEVSGTRMPVWRDYLRWQLVHAFAPYLGKAFVDENFRFAQQISGTKEQLPRWRRVLAAENAAMGFAVGHEYVKRRFPPEAKAQVLEILHGVRAALKDDIDTLAWMSPATRARANEKLQLIEERIGYPDVWRDYSALRIDRGSYVLNVLRANEFEHARQMGKIGKPVNRDEWSMVPQLVNAYYSPSMNNINFPAGILQPPFFDLGRPAAYNFGAIGAVIGHEITHGFDDQGSQFDGHGNLSNWWAPEDAAKFKAGVQCIADQFSGYTVDGGLHVKGGLVTGEAIADLGGLLLAWRALHASPAFAQAKSEGGFTPEQQFFMGFGRIWAQNTRPEQERVWATTDPHPPNNFRILGTLANVPQFLPTFGAPAGTPMAGRCVIW
jgi:putative endopeptidase